MARAREPADWDHDLAGARALEQEVCDAIRQHPEVSHFADFTHEWDLDFEFRFERETVRVELKAKGGPLSRDYVELWPEVPPTDLFMLDETAFRKMLWEEGMGYLLVWDRPARRWLYFGPWELALAPRRRLQRLGRKTGADFLKGKLLIDLRTAAASSPNLDVGALLDVVRRSRTALRQPAPIRIRGYDEPPVIPRPRPVAPPEPALEPRPDDEFETDRTWVGLSQELVAGVEQRWGWDAPTPVQRDAIPAILRGDNVLVLAPTAGGKTEAALLPLLDQWRSQGWAPVSVLALSPLKALLDDQLERYRRIAAIVGATAFAWHGDVEYGDRQRFLDDPADILLTTPESLENLLSKPNYRHRPLFESIHAVIVDEVHAFVGTPRGAQLASLVERLDRFTTTDLQRIGLSATIGNPDDVLGWLRGGSLRAHLVVGSGSPMQGEALSLVTYAELPEAVAAIQTVTGGARALVFTRSRRRAEELANGLGAPVHHASLSLEERAATAGRLTSGDVPLVVSTASLEMGIDIGHLDLIVHDGAPTGPAAYLQRLGRAGRRTGIRRMVFVTNEPDDLLLILAVLARVRRGDLETLPPGRGARLTLGQQALALAYERTVVPRRELFDALRWSPAFAWCLDAIEPTIDHLIAAGWLAVAGDDLVVGQTAHARFASRFSDLLATFSGGEGALVLDESGRKIGTVDWARIAEREAAVAEDDGLILSGRPWSIITVDRAKGTVQVRPAAKGRARSWRGPSLEIDRATWEAAREVLTATDVPLGMDSRANGWLEQLRHEWDPRLMHPVRPGATDTTVIDSFAGVAAHQAVLRAIALAGTAAGPTSEVRAPIAAVRHRASECLADLGALLDAEAVHQSTKLRVNHAELVPPAVLVAEARQYHVDDDGIGRVLRLAAGESSWPSLYPRTCGTAGTSHRASHGWRGPCRRDSTTPQRCGSSPCSTARGTDLISSSSYPTRASW
ncbi:MAG: DEAD/DEAH box helicase [Acidimicrobiales bacterium]